MLVEASAHITTKFATIKVPFYMAEPTNPELTPKLDQKPLFQKREDIRTYLDVTRAAYRSGEGSYQGRRTPEQTDIAELLGNEADEILNGVENLIVSLSGGVPKGQTEQEFKSSIKLGKLPLQSMHDAFKQLYSGWGVLTNRLARDNNAYAAQYPELFNMSDEDRMAFAGELLTDFQDLNELRFGIKGSGAMETIKAFDDEWNVIWPKVDKDLLLHNEDILRRASELGYVELAATHAAGKMSPEQVKKLRRSHPELPTTDFLRDVWFFRNVQDQLNAKQEEK